MCANAVILAAYPNMHIKELIDDLNYWVELNDEGFLPFATGAELKKGWKNKYIKKFNESRANQPKYSIIECTDEISISVRPFGYKPWTLTTEVQELEDAEKQILVG